MTIFDELRSAYALSQELYTRYAHDSRDAAHELARLFAEYLGAPASYDDPDDEAKRPYVRLLAFQIQDGVPVAAQPESPAALLTREDDGFWRFAISLALDRAADVFPKQRLTFFLRLKVSGSLWHVQLLDDGLQDFHLDAQAGDTRDLFDHMVGMVRRVLDTKPWEGVEKLPIGFELHQHSAVETGPAASPLPPLAQP